MWLIDWKKSIPQTRLRLQKMMIGLEPESGEEEWEDEREDGGKGKGSWRIYEEKKRMRRNEENDRRRAGGKG